MALDNIPTLGPGSLNSNLDKVLVYKNGGSEVAVSLLTLTNSALNLSGVYLDSVNGRVGIYNPSPSAMLTIGSFGKTGEIALHREIDGGRLALLSAQNGGLVITGGGQVLTMTNNYTNCIGTTQFAVTGAMWGIKGSGSTSATTSLLVQNSAGTTALQVKDNLQVSVGDGFAGDGIRFEPGNNSRIVFRQGVDRIYMTRSNGDQLHISFNSGPATMIGAGGICNDGSGVNFWSFEGNVNTAVTMDTTKYLKVYVAGVPYKLAVCV